MQKKKTLEVYCFLRESIIDKLFIYIYNNGLGEKKTFPKEFPFSSIFVIVVQNGNYNIVLVE